MGQPTTKPVSGRQPAGSASAAELPLVSWTPSGRSGIDQTANNSDDSPTDRIQGDHAGQHERKHDQGCAALPGAVRPCVHKCRNADENCNGKQDPARLREPKPVPEPSPIASDLRHTRSLGRLAIRA